MLTLESIQKARSWPNPPPPLVWRPSRAGNWPSNRKTKWCSSFPEEMWILPWCRDCKFDAVGNQFLQIDLEMKKNGGRWGPASWSVAAAFDRQGKAIGCEPPARDERVCPPGGEPSRVYGYRSFCPLGGRDGFACGDPLHRWGQRFVHLASRRLCGLYGPMLFTLHSALSAPFCITIL